MKELNDRINLIQDLDKKIARNVIHKHKIHYNEYLVLNVLYYNDGKKVEDIIPLVGLSSSKVLPILEQFQKEGYTKLVHTRVFLQDDANKLVKKIHADIKIKESQIINQLGTNVYEDALISLDTLISFLNDYITE